MIYYYIIAIIYSLAVSFFAAIEFIKSKHKSRKIFMAIVSISWLIGFIIFDILLCLELLK